MLQTDTERPQERALLSRKRIVHEIKLLLYRWMVYINKLEYVLESETHKFHWDFKMQTYLPVATRKLNQFIINKKKGTCHIIE